MLVFEIISLGFCYYAFDKSEADFQKAVETISEGDSEYDVHNKLAEHGFFVYE